MVEVDDAVWSASPTRPVLDDRETHLFAFGIDLPRSRIAELEPLLSEAELERAARFRFDRDRQRYVAARGRLRTILAGYTGRGAAELVLASGPFGKPVLLGDEGDRIRFSLSRSEDLGLMAVQREGELGIDVERIRPFGHALALARRMFAPVEHARLRTLPDVEQIPGFFSYWTRKEAVVKAVGRGLGYPLDAFVLSHEPEGGGEPVTLDGERGAGSLWVCQVPPPRAGFAVAVATEGPRRPLRCWMLG
jgi:4'-phosphopantetheinyl transferase